MQLTIREGVDAAVAEAVLRLAADKLATLRDAKASRRNMVLILIGALT